MELDKNSLLSHKFTGSRWIIRNPVRGIFLELYLIVTKIITPYHNYYVLYVSHITVLHTVLVKIECLCFGYVSAGKKEINSPC